MRLLRVVTLSLSALPIRSLLLPPAHTNNIRHGDSRHISISLKMGADIDNNSASAGSTEAAPQLLLSLQDHLVNTSKDKAATDNINKVRLILASQSPRRREILDMMGLKDKFDAIPSPLDESALQQQLTATGVVSDPLKYNQILAEKKALALADSFKNAQQPIIPTLVLGSDTIVELNGNVLEKPTDTADAKRMLMDLSGNEHAVHTAVAVYRVMALAEQDDNDNNDPSAVSIRIELVASFTDTAKVQFASLSEADVGHYIQTGEPMDKAGSYGIQGIGGQFVKRVEGDFFTVRERERR